jgi:hypothetical protein
MKKMNIAKGVAVGLLSVTTLCAAAQTDTTAKRTDSSSVNRDTISSTWPKQDFTVTALSTNAPIEVVYDTVNFVTLNRTTNTPLDFYILNNVDTIHGPTGLVVNGLIMRAPDGTYKLDSGKVKVDGDEIKIKMADGRKVKWENGKMKIKEWGTKAKSKADKEKMKNQWGKVRWKEGEWKVDKDS